MSTAISKWLISVCGTTSLISLMISALAIYLQSSNYRKPFEQRLIVRILLIVPLFAVTCFVTLLNPKIGGIIEPIREIYEALVIYTFYKLLVYMLGGERKIIQDSFGKPKTSHPFPANIIFSPIDFSNPSHFLLVKRCILQYVWVKPLLYLVIIIGILTGIYDSSDISWGSLYTWTGLAYNVSVTISLYYLAMFWKCLYSELKKFSPWGKFMCVKLIIFASYWQGLMLDVMSWAGLLSPRKLTNVACLTGSQIQNALLCCEMIFFALLHWNSFPYTDFTHEKYGDAARVTTFHAFKDWILLGDLAYDLKMTTLYGDTYNFRNFDSINDNRIYPNSASFNQRIYDGLRYSSDGRKYWLPDQRKNQRNHRSGSSGSSSNSVNGLHTTIDENTSLLGPHRVSYLDTVSEELQIDSIDSNTDTKYLSPDYAKDETLYHFVRTKKYVTEKILNYPVTYEYKLVDSSKKMTKLKSQLEQHRNSNSHLLRTIDESQ
ncbi:hypothetical protein KL928_001448 [Ogataea angusta]|uniref:DUF300-domain-containing protein n=2 Tax=Pichia angusta TaxID=870730 RepID=A0AAN6I6F7_PICAN|nr:uncharacterized protein KL928_001448 [Ogataea angusta]KAG7820011.1 hypothetical protein KL928_001448 [Ogataea angusta]